MALNWGDLVYFWSCPKGACNRDARQWGKLDQPSDNSLQTQLSFLWEGIVGMATPYWATKLMFLTCMTIFIWNPNLTTITKAKEDVDS